MNAQKQTAASFTIYRAAEAPTLAQARCMSVEPFTPVQRAGMDKMVAAGFLEGDLVKVLCNMPGFSLTQVWFKKNFPLPLHSHDADCLYYVIAGTLRLGTEDIAPGDSFFIPAGVPYSYKPGDEGVELLEFRHATKFNFVNHAHGEAFWNKAAETVANNRDDWRSAKRPSVTA